MMRIVFRCNNCETINEIPCEFRYRMCKNCGNLVTYLQGESIICVENMSDCDEFLKESFLSIESARKFFNLADSYKEQISDIILKHKQKSSILLDLPAASLSDTVLNLLKQNTTNSFDELIANSQLFDINLKKLEQIIKKMKDEGMIYHPKGWFICLI